MGSKAIYSEVVELILNVEGYEKRVSQAVDGLLNIGKTAKALKVEFDSVFNNNNSYFKMVAGADELIRKQNELISQTREYNKLLEERKRAAMFGPLVGPTITTHNAAQVGMGAAAVNPSNQARIRDSADAEARHQRALMESERKRRSDLDSFFSKQMQNVNLLATAERNALVNERALRHQILAEENARLVLVERRRVAEEAATRATMGYRVGKGIANTRLSDGIGMAAGGSFLLGNTNMGGALYMVERLARHTELGKKSLGELSQGFMGVTTGANASASAVAAFGTATTMVTGAVIALAVPLATMFAGNKLDNAIANMSTLLADASVKGDDFSRMMNTAANSAARLGEGFGIGLVDTVNGFKTALSTGIDASQLEEFGTIAATVTKGLGTTFEDATGILTTFRDSYNLGMGEMREVSDVLFNAINVGKFQVDDLKNNIGRVVTASAEAGVSFKDMSAGLATLTRVGLSTSQSITSMNRFIQNIVSPTDKAKAAFDRLGLATGHAAFKTQSLMQYLTQLKGAVGNNADLMGELFSTEQGRRGAIGLTTNLALTGSIVTAMDDVGTATIAANRAMDTFSQNFGKIFQTVYDVVQLVGRDLLQVANDVFFAGGPLGSDSMTHLKTMLEGIGIVVKELGILFINLLNAISAPFRLMFEGMKLIYNFMHFDFRKGIDEFVTGIGSLLKGVGNGITAMFTTIAVSADRVGENIQGVVASTDQASKKLSEGAKSVQSIFGEDAVKAVESYGAATSSVYEKITADIRKARFEAAKMQLEQSTPITTARTRKDTYKYSVAEQDLMRKISIGQSIREDNAWETEDGVKTRIRKSGGMDPEDAETKELFEALVKRIEKFNQKAGERAAKAFVEGRKKTIDAALKEQGFGDFVDVPVIGKGDRSSEGALDKMEALLALLDAIKDKAKITGTVLEETFVFGGTSNEKSASGKVTSERTKVLTEDELLAKAKEVYARLRSEYELHKNNLLESDRKYQENVLKVAEEGIKKAEEARTKERMTEYQKQYKFELEMHKQKLKMIDAERKKLQELRQNNKDDIKNIVSELQDIRSENRPGTARREFKDSAEADIRRAGQAGSAESMDAFLDSATEMLKKMVDTGDAPERASRDRKDLLETILKLRNDADKKFGAAESSIDAQERGATAAHKQSVSDNPVAQAAIAEATRIVTDMAKEAAKRGITMNGELVSNVEVNVDANIPFGALRDAIVATVKEEIGRVAADMMKKKDLPPSTGGNMTPPGTL